MSMLNESDWEVDHTDCLGCNVCDPDRCIKCEAPADGRCDECDAHVCMFCHLGRQCCAVDGER